MSKKSLLVLGVVSVLTLGALTGCQSKAASADVSVVQETESVPASSEAETVESQTEESTTEESKAEEVPYAQEQGWAFSDLSPLEMPVFVYWTDSDGNYTENGPEGVTIIQPEAVYTVGDITVSAPDEDGNVVYTIPYTIEHEIALEFQDPDNPNFGSCSLNRMAKDFALVDLYTGTVFPARDMSNDDSYDIYTDIVWDDVTYSVGYTESVEYSQGDWQRDGSIYKILMTAYEEFTVTAPAGYDGLVLLIDNNGRTEYVEMDTENISDAQSFEDMMSEDGTTLDDYTFIRISDYAG
jgi:hypothetical protein